MRWDGSGNGRLMVRSSDPWDPSPSSRPTPVSHGGHGARSASALAACGMWESKNLANYLEATAWRARSGLPAASGLIPFGKRPASGVPPPPTSPRAAPRPTERTGRETEFRTCTSIPNQPPTRAAAPREIVAAHARRRRRQAGTAPAGRPRNGLEAGVLFRCGMRFCLRAHRSTRHTPRARSLGSHPTQEARAGRRGGGDGVGVGTGAGFPGGARARPGLVALLCGRAISARRPGASRPR